MKYSTILIVVALVAGLVVGVGVGAAVSSRTITVTSTAYSTVTTSIIGRVAETRTQATTLTITEAATTPVTTTATLTSYTTFTSIATSTTTSTVYTTKTITITNTVESIRIEGAEVDLIATVYKVVDGDTFDAFPSGRVRLADINAPELNEAGGQEAKNALTNLVLNKKVYLDVDDLYVMDKYNRLICVVFVDYNSTHVLNVNKWLVENGYAQIVDYANEFNPNTWTLYSRKI
jgi:endonuclease YncB( thermonuclease family)